MTPLFACSQVGLLVWGGIGVSPVLFAPGNLFSLRCFCEPLVSAHTSAVLGKNTDCSTSRWTLGSELGALPALFALGICSLLGELLVSGSVCSVSSCRLRSTRNLDSYGNDFWRMFPYHVVFHWFDTGYTFIRQSTVNVP